MNKQVRKYQRTGLTEGSLIFNDWLKPDLYRPDTEDEFIDWLYSTSGFYDKTVKGSYFDIDKQAVKQSPVYHRFLKEFPEALKGSDVLDVMLHSNFHINGLDKKGGFTNLFSDTSYSYWQDVFFLDQLILNKTVLVVNNLAPLISQEYGVVPYRSETTFFNTGPHNNFFETLDKMWEEIEPLLLVAEITLVASGAYGCFLVDRITSSGHSAATIGSGVQRLFPLGDVPEVYIPENAEKIEEGRYFKPTLE